MSTAVVIVVVVVVLLAVAAGALVVLSKKRATASGERTAQATALRSQAEVNAPQVQQAKAEAATADALAVQARHRAEEAEERAAEVRLGATVDEAHLEDVVREADQVDPAVKHRADDYRPITPGSTPKSESGGGTHRA